MTISLGRVRIISREGAVFAVARLFASPNASARVQTAYAHIIAADAEIQLDTIPGSQRWRVEIRADFAFEVMIRTQTVDDAERARTVLIRAVESRSARGPR